MKISIQSIAKAADGTARSEARPPAVAFKIASTVSCMMARRFTIIRQAEPNMTNMAKAVINMT